LKAFLHFNNKILKINLINIRKYRFVVNSTVFGGTEL